MENLEIYRDAKQIHESKLDFEAIVKDVNKFLVECKVCKLQVKDLTQLTGLVNNLKSEARAQYLAKIKDAELETASGLSRDKEEYFKTLKTPNLDKLFQLSLLLHSRIGRIELGKLSENKLEWDQGKFDAYKNGLIITDNSELAVKLLAVAKSVNEFRAYLQGIADKEGMAINLLGNLLPNLQRLLIQEGNEIYLYPPVFNEIKEAIKGVK